jgi:predicted transcriptional regulator of viral defense system
MPKTASFALIEQLAQSHRRVLSDWRATVFLRRASRLLPQSERRWTNVPASARAVHPLLEQMVHRGELRPIPDLSQMYEVTVPFVQTGVVGEDEILMDVHPYAALSHLSALVFHDLTDELPKGITAMIPASGTAGLLPLDTDASDWEGLALVRGRIPAEILGRPLHWLRTQGTRYFGTHVYRPHGCPIRATTTERTLLDGLLEPERCGGFQNVLHAWTLARDLLDLDALVALVDRFEIAVLRQRTGFVVEELGLAHPAIETWRSRARRGGSSRLLGTSPYAPTYSERWSLSINAPVGSLRGEVA